MFNFSFIYSSLVSLILLAFHSMIIIYKNCLEKNKYKKDIFEKLNDKQSSTLVETNVLQIKSYSLAVGWRNKQYYQIALHWWESKGKNCSRFSKQITSKLSTIFHWMDSLICTIVPLWITLFACQLHKKEQQFWLVSVFSFSQCRYL